MEVGRGLRCDIRPRGRKVSILCLRYQVAVGMIILNDQQNINANEDAVVAEAMANIDAEYEALVAEYALTRV